MVLSPAKRGRFDENGENYEFAFYPPKTRVLLRPPKTTKMTKMAGVTRALPKAWFRKCWACSSLTKCLAKNGVKCVVKSSVYFRLHFPRTEEQQEFTPEISWHFPRRLPRMDIRGKFHGSASANPAQTTSEQLRRFRFSGCIRVD